MATKFTYKMRSGGNGMWGRGPAQRKNNKKKKKFFWSSIPVIRIGYQPLKCWNRIRIK
jgi:hypothetical protein